MRAFVFPGQGAQYAGMGKDLYEAYPLAKEMFERANEVLGFRLSDILFEGTDVDLKQTRVTQPAVFVHSVICSQVLTMQHPEMVAGHSLGEYSALVVCGAIRYEDALRLVSRRAEAMQRACERCPQTMAAIMGLSDTVVSDICNEIKGDIVVASNFNCPGQVVISGTASGVERACEQLRTAGARRVLRLQVGGAFHSPLMQPAAEELEEAILATEFLKPECPIYQNVNAYPQTDPEQIRQNLLLQLTAPVRWTQTVKNMVVDGATEFYEFGPGDVLKGLIRKIDPEVVVG